MDDRAEPGDRASADGAALARRARGGDAGAFAALVERHGGEVVGLCAWMLGTREEGRDAAQEAFVRAWERRASYDPARPFAAWVLRIARNLCIDRLRRRRPAAPAEAAAALPDPAPPADEAIATARAEAALARAIAALPDRFREAIVLVHLQGRPVREAAAILDVPEGTVLTWLFRGRRALREALGELA